MQQKVYIQFLLQVAAIFLLVLLGKVCMHVLLKLSPVCQDSWKVAFVPQAKLLQHQV